MTSIIVTHEDNAVDEHNFEPEIRTITIGRRSTNDVCIANLSVSGTHAKIMLSDTGAMVEDLNSTNGTYINGRLISRQLLKDGEDVVMGRVRITYVAAVDNRADDSMLDEPLTLTAKAEQTGGAAQSISSENDDDALKAESEVAPTELRENLDNSFDGGIRDESLSDSDMPVLTPSRDVTRHETESRAPQVQQTAAVSAPSDAEVMAESWQSDDAPVEHDVVGDAATTTSAVIEIKNGAKSGQVLPIDKPVTTLGRPGIQIAAIMKKPDGYFLMHIESDGEIAPPQLNNSSIGDEPVLLQSGDALNVAGIDVQFMLS